MKNFKKVSLKNLPREEMHESLGLTGAEISVNTLPAGGCVPFVHAHKKNEEIYFILSGEGKVVVDDEVVTLKKGDFVKIAPQASRQFFASDHQEITYMCIQVKENSLEEFTANDAILK